MRKTEMLPIPVTKALKKIGADIKEARIHRKLPMQLICERAGISLPTLIKVEKGDGTTSLGIYAKVLFVLNLLENLSMIADNATDTVGRILLSENLPQRIRLKKKG